MWPNGWNSQYPGRAAWPGYEWSQSSPKPPRDEARELEAARSAIALWQLDSREARKWMAGADRVDLVDALDGLMLGLGPNE